LAAGSRALAGVQRRIRRRAEAHSPACSSIPASMRDDTAKSPLTLQAESQLLN